jgi:GNAT superfamily N-acetyltransferase
MADASGHSFGMPPVYVLKVRRSTAYPGREMIFVVYREEVVTNFSCGTPKRRHLHFRYREVTSHDGGTFEAYYEPSFRGRACDDRISLTGESVMIPHAKHRGIRLGTYFMNQVVAWARQWPDVIVKPIWVSHVDGYEENRERRNRLYEQFGLFFNYSDASRRDGTSVPIPAGLLNLTGAWRDKITECPLENYLDAALSENERLTFELKNAREFAAGWMADFQRAKAHPLIWGAKTFLKNVFEKYGLIVIILVLCSALYLRFS